MNGKSDNEMAQIQKGLEDFLERELQMYSLEEEEKQKEKELDIIGSTKSNTKNSTKGSTKYSIKGRQNSGIRTGSRTDAGRQKLQNYQLYEEDFYEENFYEEDWDNEPVISSTQTQKRQGKQAAGRSTESDHIKPAKKSSKKKAPPADDTPQPARRPGKKKKKWKSRLMRFLLTMILILALVGFGLYQLVGVVYNKLNYEEIESVSELPMQEDGVVNILLIGNDSRLNGEDGRSDAMILLSISRKTKSIYMISLLRDMYVEIPGRDGNRLNAAYSYGGAELLMKTVEQNFDISVNRYVLVNFEAFANLVDAVGGVELELTSQEIEYVNGYLVEYNILTNRPQGTDNMDTSVSGLVHLNGPQALAYCRNRFLGTDFGRTERQRKVLAEVFKKLPGAVVTNGGDLIGGLLPSLTTNLTRGECFRLSLMAGRLLTYDIASDSIPQPGTYTDAVIRRMQVLQVDFEANKKYLKEKLYGESGN